MESVNKFYKRVNRQSAGFSLPHRYHPATPKLQNTSKQEHNQCGDTIEKSQAPDDGCINVRNMLSVEEVK